MDRDEREPRALLTWREGQTAALADPSEPREKGRIDISDDEIRASLEGAQLKFQRERGTDITIFSPRAAGMAHYVELEMVGAIRSIDPETGRYFDDTKRYIDQMTVLNAADRHKIFEVNSPKIYPLINNRIPAAV